MSWKPPTLFSQNFEDLYLWRIFKEQEKGFYIDVGAYHPETHSVTKIFYDQGWQGINIEPVPSLFSLFQQDRPRDTNLPILISNQSGRRTLNTFGDSGLSSVKSESWTSAPIEFKDKHQSIEVESRTLYEIIMTYTPAAIDFLKVDVEGLEADVIKGLCGDILPTSMRPKVILIEATISMSRVPGSCRDECKKILEDWGYLRFFFDGLNDYYCLQPDFARCSAITLPPNVFDGIPLTPEAFQASRKRESLLTKELTYLREEVSSHRRKSRDLLQDNEVPSDSLINDYNILIEQWNDLRDEVLRLHLANTRLSKQIKQSEQKLSWLRCQREALLTLIKRATKTLAHSSIIHTRIESMNRTRRSGQQL